MTTARCALLLAVLLVAPACGVDSSGHYDEGGCGSRAAYIVLRHYGFDVQLKDTVCLIDGEGQTSLSALRASFHEDGLHTVLEKIDGNIVIQLRRMTLGNGRHLFVAALGPREKAHSVVLAWRRFPDTIAWINPDSPEVRLVTETDELVWKGTPVLMVSDQPIAYIPSYRKWSILCLSSTLGLLLGIGTSWLAFNGPLKRYLGLIALILVCAHSSCILGCNEEGENPRDAVGRTLTGELTKDLGERDVGSVVECAFTLENNSERTINIKKLNPTCTCTRPSASAESIPPGGVVEITTSYSVSTPGRSVGILYVHIDDPVTPVVALRIQCVGTRLAQLPGHVYVGALLPHETTERQFVLKLPRNLEHPLNEIRLASSDQRVQCKIIETEESGEWRVYRAMLVTAAKDWESEKVINATMTAFGTDSSGQTVTLGEMSVYGEIKEPYYAEPAAVFLPDAVVGREVSVSIALVSRSGTFGRLGDIAVSGACREARALVKSDDNARTIIAAVLPDRPGYFVGEVSINLSDLAEPLIVKLAGKAEALKDTEQGHSTSDED